MSEPPLEVKGLRLVAAVVWFIDAMVVVAIVLLAFAFFLELFDANRSAAFTQWVYRSDRYVLEPFRGIFPVVRNGGSVLNYSILFAIFVYGLLALLADSIADWLDTMARRRHIDILARQRDLYGPPYPAHDQDNSGAANSLAGASESGMR